MVETLVTTTMMSVKTKAAEPRRSRASSPLD